MRKIMLFLILFFLLPVVLMSADKNKGDFSNLVCFLRFADEDETIFERPLAEYESMFNDETVGANSVYNYFKEASYSQLFWKSKFFPLSNGTKIISYKAKQERAYYNEKGETVNIGGYTDEMDKMSREQALIKELVTYLSTNLPTDINIDSNADGFVDNLCIIVSGYSDLSSRKLLWPHRSALTLQNVPLINGKKAAEYLMVFDDANSFTKRVDTGVLCHEMSHTLGTYDLYHVNDKLNPVGEWDLMADNLNKPQQMSVYTKYKYCKWIDNIPEISTPGTYKLHPVGGISKENIAYKIKPIGSDEYFVLEYRKKEGTFDSGLASSGLLIYRINDNFRGNSNFNGRTKFDEQYLFRPNGTMTDDGDITKAAFSAENGRTTFGGTSSLKPFYTDGTAAKFAIDNISSCGETISFDLLEIIPQIYLPQSTALLSGVANTATQLKVQSDIDWKATNVPTWMTISPMEGKIGTTTITITAISANEVASPRMESFMLIGKANTSVTATVNVIQSSNIIHPPHSLKAVANQGKVTLSWIAPKEGSPVLTEDFEDIANPKGWVIKNENQKGWVWSFNEKSSEAHGGNYSVRMRDELDDRHQNEWLISPTFSKGRLLSFYSKSTAPGKIQNPPKDHYFVEVSKDGGNTWDLVFDLMKGGKNPNKYERIDIDLSNYLSDNMKVAFHAYDLLNTGVSYWWNVDDVSIYPQVEQSLVTQYGIYRNGIKIGTSSTCTFVDESPFTDTDNIYTVKAEGTFGETPDSDPVTVTGQAIVEVSLRQIKEVLVSVANGTLTVESESPVCDMIIYSLTGMKAVQEKPNASDYIYDLQYLPPGVYVVVLYIEEYNRYIIRKIVK